MVAVFGRIRAGRTEEGRATRPPTTQTEPDDLGRRLRERDATALETLYELSGRKAFGLAYRIVGDGGAAEDAVQEAFLAVWEQADRIQPGRRIEPLLLTVVHRRAIDQLRARGRREARSHPTPVDALETIDQEAADILGRVADAQTFERVREGLAALSTEQRATVELAYFDGLTQREIAETMGVPLGTVKSRLRLAMERLRATLGLEAAP